MSVGSASKPRNGIPPWRRLLLDEDELAEMLGVSRPTVRRYVDLGLFYPIEMPLGIRRTLYRRSDVEAAVEALPLLNHEAAG